MEYEINVGGENDFYDDIFHQGRQYRLVIEPDRCWVLESIGYARIDMPSFHLPDCTGESLRKWLEDKGNHGLLLAAATHTGIVAAEREE